MPVASVLDLSQAVWELLDAPPLTAYDGIVEPAPPRDRGGAVKGYAVLYPGAGDATSNNLAAEPGQLLWTFQVTCAGGARDYVAWTVDEVRRRLDGKPLVVAGATVGLMRPPLGYTPPMLVNSDVQPPRISVPLQYQVLAASTA